MFWRWFWCRLWRPLWVFSELSRHPSCLLSLIGQTCLSLCSHCCHSLLRCQTFSCLFLFLLTLPLHEVMIPLFCFVFLFSSFYFHQMDPALLFMLPSPFYPTPTPSFFLFFSFCKFYFWRQQVGIDQGDIPDLSQVSVHLTVHLSNSNLLTFFPPKESLLQHYFLSHCSLCAFIHWLTLYFTPAFACFSLLTSCLLPFHSPPYSFFVSLKES